MGISIERSPPWGFRRLRRTAFLTTPTPSTTIFPACLSTDRTRDFLPRFAPVRTRTVSSLQILMGDGREQGTEIGDRKLSCFFPLHTTSAAKLMILTKPSSPVAFPRAFFFRSLSRSSRATAPNTRVPMGFLLLSINTAALESNLT